MKNIVFVLPWVFLMLLSLATSWIYPQILPEFNLEGLVNVLPGKTLMQSIALSLFAGVFSTSIGFFLAKREKPSIWTFLPYFVAPVILGAGLHYFLSFWDYLELILGYFLVRF
jgi:ABC-type spermidine/putrescine transport system permease subunit II